MMTRLPRAVIVFLITTSCVIFDQATKFIAKIYLGPGALISFAGDTFRLQYAENSAAFLSLGASLQDPWRNLVFTLLLGIISIVILGDVLYISWSIAVAIHF